MASSIYDILSLLRMGSEAPQMINPGMSQVPPAVRDLFATEVPYLRPSGPMVPTGAVNPGQALVRSIQEVLTPTEVIGPMRPGYTPPPLDTSVPSSGRVWNMPGAQRLQLPASAGASGYQDATLANLLSSFKNVGSKVGGVAKAAAGGPANIAQILNALIGPAGQAFNDYRVQKQKADWNKSQGIESDPASLLSELAYQYKNMPSTLGNTMLGGLVNFRGMPGRFENQGPVFGAPEAAGEATKRAEGLKPVTEGMGSSELKGQTETPKDKATSPQADEKDMADRFSKIAMIVETAAGQYSRWKGYPEIIKYTIGKELVDAGFKPEWVQNWIQKNELPQQTEATQARAIDRETRAQEGAFSGMGARSELASYLNQIQGNLVKFRGKGGMTQTPVSLVNGQPKDAISGPYFMVEDQAIPLEKQPWMPWNKKQGIPLQTQADPTEIQNILSRWGQSAQGVGKKPQLFSDGKETGVEINGSFYVLRPDGSLAPYTKTK